MRYPTATLPTLACMAAFLGLVACTNAPGVRINNIDISQQYNPQELGIFSGSNREVRVDVFNNPFPEVSQQEFGDVVVGFMYGRTPGYPVRFSQNPEVEYRPERRIRVLMVFDPPKSLPSVGLCRRDIQGGLTQLASVSADAPPDPTRIRALGAYCQGEQTTTRVIGSAPRGPDLASTNLNAMVGLMTFNMFPIRNPNVDRENCDPFVVVC